MKKINQRSYLAIIILFFFQIVFAQKPESNISTSFDFAYKSETIKNIKIAYYEKGIGDPILFLHGIPESSYIWRNIVPEVSKHGRTIAMDLPGYGKSEIPSKNDYTILSHYEYVKGFIEKLNLKNITLVVTDIGSLYGLKYAIENDANIKSIIFIEGMFMPSREWYKSLQVKQKMMFAMMRNEKRAYKMLVKKNKMPSMMLKMAMVNKPAQELKRKYEEPYLLDIEKRKVMLYGAGPHTVPKKGKSKKVGDFSDVLNKNAEGLIRINQTVPFLIIHANPGMIVRKKNIAYAKKHFKNASYFNVGKGKHYLTEDHPKAIATKIVNWIALKK